MPQLTIFTLACIAIFVTEAFASVAILGASWGVMFWVVTAQATIGSFAIAYIDRTEGAGLIYPLILTVVFVVVGVLYPYGAPPWGEKSIHAAIILQIGGYIAVPLGRELLWRLRH